MKKFQSITALLLAAVMMLSGCGAERKSEDAMYSNSSAGWMEDAKSEEPGAVSMEGTSVEKMAAADIAARKMIRTVSMSMETKEFNALKDELEGAVVSFGGYVENSDFDAQQRGYHYRYYSLTVRIPAENLDAFVETAGEMGTLTNKSESMEDVTLDYVDKTAYKDSLRAEYDRVMELLEQAKDLDQVLALETKLSQLRYEINSYESQLRTYDNLINYSTVHIYIDEVEYEKEMADTIGSRITNGFRGSLYAVRDFFVNLFVWLVSNLPILLLLAVLTALAVLLTKKFMKRAKNRKMRRMNQAMSAYKNEIPVPEKTEKENE